MNRRAVQIVAGFVLIVGLTALLLHRVQSNYVLGKPGLKLVDVPIYNEETNIVSSISAFLPEKAGFFSMASSLWLYAAGSSKRCMCI